MFDSIIIDGHEDLAWNAVELGRDETRPLAEIRAREGAVPAHGEGTATVSLPSLRTGGVRIVMATIFTAPAGTSSIKSAGYHTPQEAFDQAMAQVEYYHTLDRAGEVRLLRDRAGLEAAAAGKSPQPGLVLLMESADPLRTPDDLALFHAAGVRIVGPSWKATRYAGGTGMPGPLTELGRELMREMDRLGVVLDVSHLAEEAFWQALEIYRGPVIASHANCRTIVPTDRQLSDEMIRAVAGRGGVIGIVFYNPFIHPDKSHAVVLADLLPHIAHLTDLVGTAHIGLGSDLDGGVGREVIPAELDSVADLPKIADLLAGAGYDANAIAGIMGENWLQVLREIFTI